MMNDSTPIYTANQMDVLRNRIAKLEHEKSILFSENEELRQACNKLQTNQGFVKASDDLAQQKQQEDGEARITDQKMLRDFIMDSLKLKPREVIIKYRGSIVMEIKNAT